MEILERLISASDAERWLVRHEGTQRVAMVFFDRTPEVEPLAQRVQHQVGFAHPRIGAVHATERVDRHLLAIVDDDRGPLFVEAATVLAGVERERWAVGQIIAVADGLAALARHVPGFVHGQLAEHAFVVAQSGHVRLRAPLELPKRFGTRAGGLWDAHWASPELVANKPATAASDVFVLASNLAYALSGRRPFDHETGMRTLVAVLRNPADPIVTLEPGLAGVLARAWAKDPAARYPDPGAFAAALREQVPDAPDYDAVISDRIAAWWPTSPASHATDLEPGHHCLLPWTELVPTTLDAIRRCSRCDQAVVRIDDAVFALPLVGKRCSAF